MADLKRLAEDATTRAAIAAGKDAAKRALDDLVLSDEEKAKRETSTVEVQKSRRWRYIALAVLGLFLMIGVVGLMLKFWTYFLFAGVLGVAAVYAWWRFQKSRKAAKDAKGAATEDAPVAVAKAKAEPVRVVEEPAIDVAAQRAAAAQEARERAEAQREARAETEREIDDELAQMKAKLKK